MSLVFNFADPSEEVSPEAQLGIAVRLVHFKQWNKDINKWATLIDYLLYVAESKLDENLSELVSLFEVAWLNDCLHMVLQHLHFSHHNASEGSKVVLFNTAELHEFYDTVDGHLKVIFIFRGQLLED